MTSKTAIWGLTGGIASGKSMVGYFFEQAGIPVLDADLISRELSGKKGKAYPAIIRRFGTNDRAKLRKLVFSDPIARKDLEAILHPLIRAETASRTANLSKPLAIYEAALLVETGGYKELAGLIVVQAPLVLRRQRLMDRNGFTAELADSILAAQLSDLERRKVANVIIENAGSLEDLRQQTLSVIYSTLFARS